MDSNKVITYCCSVQGKEHIRRGIPCQDVSCLEEVAEGLYLLVIADGCGSAPKAGEGSRAAVTRVKDFMESKMPLKNRNRTVEILKTLCYTSLLEADMYLSALAEDQHCRESDFATTLTVCLYDAGLRKLGFAHIGDGAIWVRSNGVYKKITREIRPPFMPDNYVTLLYHGASHWIFGEAHNISAVFACTDGILRNLHQLIEAQIDKNFLHFCGEDSLGDPAKIITDLLWQVRDDKTVCAVLQND